MRNIKISVYYNKNVLYFPTYVVHVVNLNTFISNIKGEENKISYSKKF